MTEPSAKVVMDAATRVVHREMKARGFAKRALTFHRLTEHGTRLLVQLQRSVESTAACIRVAINFIPRTQHTSTFRKFLHPDNKGGFKIWGKLY